MKNGKTRSWIKSEFELRIMWSCVFDFAVLCGVWHNVRCTQHDSLCAELQFCFSTNAKRHMKEERRGEGEIDRKRKLQWRVKTSSIPTTVSIHGKVFQPYPCTGSREFISSKPSLVRNYSRFATDHIVLSMKSKRIYGIASFIFAVRSLCLWEQGLNHVYILTSTQNKFASDFALSDFCKTSSKSLKLVQMYNSLVSLKSGHKMKKKMKYQQKKLNRKKSNKHICTQEKSPDR